LIKIEKFIKIERFGSTFLKGGLKGGLKGELKKLK
jgi:hypothetical protein